MDGSRERIAQHPPTFDFHRIEDINKEKQQKRKEICISKKNKGKVVENEA